MKIEPRSPERLVGRLSQDQHQGAGRGEAIRFTRQVPDASEPYAQVPDALTAPSGPIEIFPLYVAAKIDPDDLNENDPSSAIVSFPDTGSP